MVSKKALSFYQYTKAVDMGLTKTRKSFEDHPITFPVQNQLVHFQNSSFHSLLPGQPRLSPIDLPLESIPGFE